MTNMTTLDTNEISVNHISFIEEGLAAHSGRKVRAFVEDFDADVDHVSPAAMLSAVKTYAVKNYESGKGWDYLVETMSDDEILALIGRARTVNGAIWAVWNKSIRTMWLLCREQRQAILFEGMQ